MTAAPPPAAVTEFRGDAGAELAGLVAGWMRDVPDFPQPGIIFKDIVPLLADAGAFATTIAALAGFAGELGPLDAVAGIEARGFILAAALARELNCGLILVRKAGKLPPPVLSRSYALEYGTAEIEISEGVAAGRRIFLADDVLATGGTLEAATLLLAEAGAELTGIGVLLELEFLAGRARLPNSQVRALLTL